MCDKQAIAQMHIMHDKTNLLLMAPSICLHFCKLLRSSLIICLEFAPPQENQELTHKTLSFTLYNFGCRL